MQMKDCHFMNNVIWLSSKMYNDLLRSELYIKIVLHNDKHETDLLWSESPLIIFFKLI